MKKIIKKLKKKNPKLFSKKFKVQIVSTIDEIIPNIFE